VSRFDAIEVGRRVLSVEAEALGALSQSLGDAFTQAVEAIFKAKGRVVCTGIGKSGHVARKIAATLASTGTPAMFVHAAEASHGDLGMVGPDDVVLALSKSGEVRELADILAYTGRFSIPMVGITAAPQRALRKAKTKHLLLPDPPQAPG
jgi:arabinose-5-phosphate isomerase